MAQPPQPRRSRVAPHCGTGSPTRHGYNPKPLHCKATPNPLMRLALFEPDIAQNTGALLRLAACLGVSVDLIEPCGFVLSDKRLRRSGMDYLDRVDLTRHSSWAAFTAQRGKDAGKIPRLLLLTTRGAVDYTAFAFRADDVLLLGRESAGAPPEVHAAADARLRIPMIPEVRSLNMAMAAAMVLGEALRQTGLFPAATARGE